MTDQPASLDLDDIEARVNAATDGPWGFYDGETYADVAADMQVTSPGSYNYREKIARLEDENYWDDGDHEDHDDSRAPEQMAANAAFIAHAREDVPALIAEIRRLRDELADARAQALRDAAEICDEAGAVYGSRGANDAAGAAFALMERFQRKANEAEYAATPCSVAACEPGGEPCSTHERLMAHGEGDHELCEPDCAAPIPCDRCKGTGVDPEHSAADGIDGPAYLEPCSACQLAAP